MAVGLLVLIVVAAAPLGLRWIGRWLVVRDPLAPAEVILVHGGHLPFRPMQAAAIFDQGVAPEIWLLRVRPNLEARALEALGIVRTPGVEISRNVLENLGVPRSAIRVLEEPVRNTADEIRVAMDELRRQGKRSVILVTSKQHSRRVRATWRALADDSLTAAVRFAREDPFDPDQWWRNTTDARAVINELFGILNVKLGFPLRPERGRPPGGHPASRYPAASGVRGGTPAGPPSGQQERKDSARRPRADSGSPP